MSDPSIKDRMRLLRSLYITIFLISTSYGTMTFLLPVYAENLGATYVELGILGAIGSIVYTLMTVLTGILLDRYERIQFFFLSTATGVLVPSFLSLTSNVSELFVLRGFLGIISAAFWVTASTLTADISPTEELTRSVVRYNLSWISGFVVGPILGGFFSDRYGFPALFLLVAALSIPSVLLIKSKLSGNIELRASTGGIWKGISALKPITFAYVTLVPFAIVLGIYMAILPGHMRIIGISASAIGFLLTLTNTVRGVGFFSSEYWVNWGIRRSIWVSSILLCGAFFAVSFSSNTLDFVLPLSVFGFAGGIITPVILDYIAHRSPNESLGAAMGLHEFVYGIGMSLGPIIGGTIAENFDPSILYKLLAVLVLFIIPFSFRMSDNGEFHI